MDLIQLCIYFHAAFGGIALIAGLFSAISIKGSQIHKKTGTLFHHSMVISVSTSIFIALTPSHFNPFLLGIGIFSLYSVISGRRCLKVIKPNFNIEIDKGLAYILLINSFLMLLLPLVFQHKINIILSIFGIIGVITGMRDLKAYKNIAQLKTDRIKHHINKISGGYIAAITAFLVVNQLLPGYWAWFTPTVLGGIFATYYNLKYTKGKV